MKKNFPFIVIGLLALLCIAATISSSRLNTSQIGYDPTTGNWWITNNFNPTNENLRGLLTIYGSSTGAAITVNTNQFVVTNGNVGVGLANPVQKLQVSDPLSLAPSMKLLGSDLATFISFQIGSNLVDGGTIGARVIFNDLGSGGQRWEFNNGGIVAGGLAVRLPNTLGNVMTWSSNGNVGLGTTAPSERLHVNGNGIIQTNLFVTNGIASYASNLLAVATITIGASPSSWTNTLNKNVVVYTDGVSVTGTLGVNGGVIFNTIGQCTVILQPGDYQTITYTVGTPTATWRPF